MMRLAVGAARDTLAMQFLGEKVIFCVCGALRGIALSLAGSLGFERVLDWPVVAVAPVKAEMIYDSL